MDARIQTINEWEQAAQKAKEQLDWLLYYLDIWKGDDRPTDTEFMAVMHKLSRMGLDGWLDTCQAGLDRLRAEVIKGE